MFSLPPRLSVPVTNIVTGPNGEIVSAPGKFTLMLAATYVPGESVMLCEAPLILRLPGADDPNGRFIAPVGTGTTVRPPGAPGVCLPLMIPPLLMIDVPA